jgi:hypothetical protein
MIRYHVSPISDLDKRGLAVNAKTLHNYYEMVSRFLFLGTLNYIENHYLKYSTKGTWFVYEVDCSDLNLTELPTKDQWKYGDNIPSDRVRKVKVVDVS